MGTISLKIRRMISICLIINALPLAIASAATDGGLWAFVFAAILAFGVDILFDKKEADSINKK